MTTKLLQWAVLSIAGMVLLAGVYLIAGMDSWPGWAVFVVNVVLAFIVLEAAARVVGLHREDDQP